MKGWKRNTLVMLALTALLAFSGNATADDERPEAPDESPLHTHEAGLLGESVSEEALRGAAAQGRYLRQRPLVQRRSARSEGALQGRTIAVSAGHGIQYNGGSWLFQRTITNDIREDIHTNQIAIDYFIPMLERAGAKVLTVRERTFLSTSATVDNSDTGYTESGSWSTGGSPGYEGDYRFAFGDTGASATWSFTVTESGEYPIYVNFLSGSNRSEAARYTIEHAYGEAVATLQQNELLVQSSGSSPPAGDETTAPTRVWRYLTTLPFAAGQTYTITLSTTGTPSDRVVIADAVHIGGGREAAAVGGTTSGLPRWQESASTFLRWVGVPAWLGTNDVTIRPLYAIFEGSDAYVSIHTNASNGAGSGTSTWTWYPEMFVRPSQWPSDFVETELPPGTDELANTVHDEVVRRLRANIEPTWDDDGRVGANFGELRPIRNAWYNDAVVDGLPDPTTIPAFLIELAFHDTPYDASFIREADFREESARAMLVGLIRHFNGASATIPPLPPEDLLAIPNEEGLTISWEPRLDPLENSAAPTSYRVYTSRDGVLFSPEGIATSANELTIPLDGCAARYVRVTAVNSGGESLPSPVVGGARAALDGQTLLLVDGIDRVVTLERDPARREHAVAIYGNAVSTSTEGLGFASATDEAIDRAFAALTPDAVIWALGETSTVDESLDVGQQSTLRSYLSDNSAQLIISGAELGWDLVARGSGDDITFFEQDLQSSYLSDDAATTTATSGLVAGDITFGDCSGLIPCVEFPDVLAPLNGGETIASYSGGTAGAAYTASPDARVIVGGFPLETIVDPLVRETVILALVESLPHYEGSTTTACVDESDTGDDSPNDAGPDTDTLNDANDDTATDITDTGDEDVDDIFDEFDVNDDASDDDTSPPFDAGNDDDSSSSSSEDGCNTARRSPAPFLTPLILVIGLALRRRR